ncbi:glycosyltransferase [Thiospirillum jenense]|uniref:Glycosyltransferase n=1 Tax=Thiospirillum jenense TaxID=1653858 RepID=A0A839HFX0_9GAMM|nr:glycosyltransferase [Thiospirillum jenense]MBB1126940.1 glycosyltransferase [Thiospirillum jenense]
MNVLMISDVYFPRVNGVSTSIQTFAREFITRGHDVTLIAPDYGRETIDPFTVIRMASRYLPLDPEDRMLRWRQLRQYDKQLTSSQFDLVHIHTPFIAHYLGIALARRFNLPVVESYHTFFEQYLNHYVPLIPAAWLRWIARRFSRTQCNTVNGLIVPSQAMLDVLRDYRIETHAAVIPTGIELNQFGHGNGIAFRQRYAIDLDRPLLVHVGRLAFEKNIDFLLKMLCMVKKEIPNVLLAIAGEGPALSSLKDLAHRLGLSENTCFVGYLSRDGALEDCYCAGDAFVFASRTETQGLVLLEAMALGTPVISTAVMGTREILHIGHGCLIAEEHEADFAAQTVKLLKDSALRTELSQQARQYAQLWSAPVLAQRLLTFYDQVITAYRTSN